MVVSEGSELRVESEGDDYNGGIHVHSSLLNLVLHEQPQIEVQSQRKGA